MRRSQARRRKRLFLVSPFVPYPPARGIELRIVRLLRWLKSEGYDVFLVVPVDGIDDVALTELSKITARVYWTPQAWRTRMGTRFPRIRRTLWEPLKSVSRLARRALKMRTSVVPLAAPTPTGPPSAIPQLGDESVKAWFAPPQLIRLVGKLARKYDPHAVIVEYMFSSPVFSALPAGILRIIDTIDVFSQKEHQVLSYGIADPLASSESEERRYLMQADILIAIQSREARLLESLVPEREVVLAGIDLDVVPPNQHESNPSSISVVASDNPLNVHGLTEFLSECWPTIKKAWPAATLHVVGKVGDMCRVDDSAIRYSGWIDDLDQVYSEASIVINPTIAGTGLKIKSVQALAHGKPLVAWPLGVEGLDYEGIPPFKVCHSWAEFADAVVLLLRSDEERLKLSQRAHAYATDKFGPNQVYAALKTRLENHGLPRMPLETEQRSEIHRTVSAR